MTTSSRVVVTAGPTINAADIRAVVPTAEIAAPIAFGEALSYGLRPGDVLLVIDGLFLQQASVRHKELLTLIADDVRVLGSSSMGALRAAELHPFGMEGYGWVFENYRDGSIDADDEVAVVHGSPDDGYPVFVDALVNMRHTVARAVDAGVLSASLAAKIIDVARNTTFTLRGWGQLLADIGEPDPRVLAAQLRSLRVDIKHADALLALHAVEHGRRQQAVRPGPPPTVWSQRWRQRFSAPTDVAVTNGDGDTRIIEVSDIDVLSLLSIASSDRWAYLPALEQVAAWYWSLMHPGEDRSVRDRAQRAVSDLAAGSYRRALETTAHRYAVATGIIDDSGFPASASYYWLTPEEHESLSPDPVAVSARVLTRTLFFARSLPGIQHFLDLIRSDPRLPQWRTIVAQALSMRAELARQKPHLNLDRPAPTQLKRLFGARWGTPVDRVELARRGLLTEEAFYNAATPFAVAAADDRLPLIEVGHLGELCEYGTRG